jgi:hypothetical protein
VATNRAALTKDEVDRSRLPKLAIERNVYSAQAAIRICTLLGAIDRGPRYMGGVVVSQTTELSVRELVVDGCPSRPGSPTMTSDPSQPRVTVANLVSIPLMSYNPLTNCTVVVLLEAARAQSRTTVSKLYH